MKKKCLVISLIVVFSFCLSFASFILYAYNNIKMSLEGKIVFVDCGHGGNDNGASVDGVLEDSINMIIGGYLLESLVDSGAYVLMSRTGDYDLADMYSKNRKREDLNKRVRYINSSKPDLFVSIHLNTFPSNKVRGGQVFYQDNNDSKMLSDFIQNELNVLTNENKKSKRGDYFILNQTSSVGVLVECGFLSNDKERNLLNNSDYQIKIANTIKKGIVSFYNNV